MKETLNVQTKIKIEKETELPAGLIIEILKTVNDTYYKSEINDLRDLRKEFPEIPSIVFDATEFRMNQERNSAVLVRGINKGSVELLVVGSGLLIWLLQQTLGETIKEAWLEGKWHKKIKDFLLGRRYDKLHRIDNECKKSLERKLKTDVEMGSSASYNYLDVHISISFFPSEKRAFPRTPDDMLDYPE